MVTGTPPNDERVYPKFGGAAAVLVIGALSPVAAAVAGSAAVMVVLATWMVLTGDGPGTRAAVGSERDGFEDLDRGRPARGL
jgi:hypothetical protein